MKSDNTASNTIPDIDEIERELKERPRSATLLNLKWLAERMRRTCAIKESLANGCYKVDSAKIAQAIIFKDGK